MRKPDWLPDWRDDNAYEYMNDFAYGQDWAWEFCRRNSDYQAQWIQVLKNPPALGDPPEPFIICDSTSLRPVAVRSPAALNWGLMLFMNPELPGGNDHAFAPSEYNIRCLTPADRDLLKLYTDAGHTFYGGPYIDVDVTIDLSLSIKGQLKQTIMNLEELQRQCFEKVSGTGLTLDSRGRGGKAQNWQDRILKTIRAYDAKCANAKPKDIAQHLGLKPKTAENWMIRGVEYVEKKEYLSLISIGWISLEKASAVSRELNR